MCMYRYLYVWVSVRVYMYECIYVCLHILCAHTGQVTQAVVRGQIVVLALIFYVI